MSQQTTKQKLQEIQEEKDKIKQQKQTLDQLEKDLIESEKLYNEILAQEIEKQEKTIDISNYIESKIAEFEEKAKNINLTNLKFVHNKDKQRLQLVYIDQNGYEESVFYIHDYSTHYKTYIKDLVDFHVENIGIYNQLINQLPTDFFGFISFYHDRNTIAITTESTRHTIKIVENSNDFIIESYISTYDINSFTITLNNNLKLSTYMNKSYDERFNSTDINIELSRTSTVKFEDIASQINQDMKVLENQLKNNFKFEYL